MKGEQEEKKYYEAMHQDDYKIKYNMQDPLSYLASSEPDTIGQAMNQPNRK